MIEIYKYTIFRPTPILELRGDIKETYHTCSVPYTDRFDLHFCWLENYSYISPYRFDRCTNFLTLGTDQPLGRSFFPDPDSISTVALADCLVLPQIAGDEFIDFLENYVSIANIAIEDKSLHGYELACLKYLKGIIRVC